MEKGKKVLVGLAVLCIFIGFGAFAVLLRTGTMVAPIPVAVAPVKDNGEQPKREDGPKVLAREEALAEMKRMNPNFDPTVEVAVLTEKKVLAEMKRMNPNFDPTVQPKQLSLEEVEAELKRMMTTTN